MAERAVESLVEGSPRTKYAHHEWTRWVVRGRTCSSFRRAGEYRRGGAACDEAGFDPCVEKYDIDLDASYACGDTMGDLSMLQLVDNPIAINLTRELLTHLTDDPELRSKVDLAVEPTDVIYLINIVQTWTQISPEDGPSGT